MGQGRAGGVSWGAPLKLWRKSEGRAAALIGRLDANSMPVIFWQQVTREEEGREGGRMSRGPSPRGTWGWLSALEAFLGHSVQPSPSLGLPVLPHASFHVSDLVSLTHSPCL